MKLPEFWKDSNPADEEVPENADEILFYQEMEKAEGLLYEEDLDEKFVL